MRSLTLLATHCGSAHAVLADRKVTNLLFSKGAMTPEQSLNVMAPYVYAKDTPAHRIAEDAAVRLATYPTLRDYQGQLNGLLYWSSHSELRRIQVETLVLHGLEDQLIPPTNGRMLAERIPHARLIELPRASHWASTDQTEAVATAVQVFVAANARGIPTSDRVSS